MPSHTFFLRAVNVHALLGFAIASVNAATLAPVATEGQIIGTTYLFDGNAGTGGGDFNGSSANFVRMWSSLNVGSAGSQVTITGLAFGLPTAGNTTGNALTATISYYGANGVAGGGDDVSFGSTTATLNLVGISRYEWLFDTPLVQTIDGVGSVFLVNLAGTNSLRIKTTATNLTSAGDVKIDIAGTSTAVPEPSATLLAGIGFLGLLRRRR